MILKDKVLFWANQGVPQNMGDTEGEGEGTMEVETEEILPLNKETFEDGTFVEAVLFKLYYEGWIEAEDWDQTEKDVIALIEEELKLRIS